MERRVMHFEETTRNTQTFNTNGHSANDHSFQELLEDYAPVSVQKGQFIPGTVLKIDGSVLLADVAAKRTAVVPPQDLARLTEDDLNKISVGDEVMLYVIRTPVDDQELLVSIEKGLQHQDWLEAQDCLESSELLNLEVVGHNKGGLLVAFGRLRGFIPNSHVPALQRIHDAQALTSHKSRLVGQELPLKVIEVDRDRRRLVLSARAASDAVRSQRLAEMQEHEGKTLEGTVTGIVKFGAFVDLGGVEGLVHISEIAWQQVDRVSDFLTIGDTLEVKILAVDIEKGRISLSRKALLPSPWEEFATAHAVGDLLEAVVTSVVDFGAFAQVADGIEGLIHVSEMHGGRNNDPHDILHTGDTVLVRIISLEPDAQRLGLSQRRVSRDQELEYVWQKQAETSEAAETTLTPLPV